MYGFFVTVQLICCYFEHSDFEFDWYARSMHKDLLRNNLFVSKYSSFYTLYCYALNLESSFVVVGKACYHRI